MLLNSFNAKVVFKALLSLSYQISIGKVAAYCIFPHNGSQTSFEMSSGPDPRTFLAVSLKIYIPTIHTVQLYLTI